MTNFPLSGIVGLDRDIEAVTDAIKADRKEDRRYVLAIVGAPGAGKSTFADALNSALNRDDLGVAEVLPMDGFHLDNAVLFDRNLQAKKGAPETFDADGFASVLARIGHADKDVLVPVFDRKADLSRAGARVIKAATKIIIVEGNYLLLERDEWAQLREYYDLTVFLDVPKPILEQRLIARWVNYGLDRGAATVRAQGNDLVNADVVINQSVPADMQITYKKENLPC